MWWDRKENSETKIKSQENNRTLGAQGTRDPLWARSVGTQIHGPCALRPRPSVRDRISVTALIWTIFTPFYNPQTKPNKQ